MLLLITGSNDGTSDLIVAQLGDRVFRLNFDLFADYKLELSPKRWRIEDPTGRFIDSDTVTRCFWWKAFNYDIVDADPFIVEEVKYVFRELYNWCRLRNLVRGNPPDFHHRLGKVNLLSIAAKHFSTPLTLASFGLAGVSAFEGRQVVAKSFSSGLTTTNRALFTTRVELATLHPDYPWYLQEAIQSDDDVTVFVCGEQLFCYQRDRRGLEGLDWRAEQSMTPGVDEWARCPLSGAQARAIHAFCADIGVDWGRLDFLRVNDELVFLEFNANGQWVFLDYASRDRLVETVAQWMTH